MWIYLKLFAHVMKKIFQDYNGLVLENVIDFPLHNG